MSAAAVPHPSSSSTCVNRPGSPSVGLESTSATTLLRPGQCSIVKSDPNSAITSSQRACFPVRSFLVFSARATVLSVLTVTDRPYKSVRSFFKAQTTAKHSSSLECQRDSSSVNRRLQKCKTLSLPCWLWDNTAPKAS